MGEFDLDDFYAANDRAPAPLPTAPDLYDVRVYAEGGALDGVVRIFAGNQEDAYLKLRAMALGDVHKLVREMPIVSSGQAPVIGVDRRRALRPGDRPQPEAHGASA